MNTVPTSPTASIGSSPDGPPVSRDVAAPAPAPPRSDVPTSTLIPFVLLTFGITWGLFALFVLVPELVTRWLGPPSGSHPLFILGTWSPALAAGMLVVRASGTAGLRRFLRRLLLWRAPGAWWAFLLLGLPALFYAGALLAGTDPAGLLPSAGPGDILMLAAFMVVLGPVEEIGWRGLALPLLQRRLTPLAAGLVVGVVWAIWHVPAFLLAGTLQSGWSFSPFLVGTVAASVIITPLVNAGRGSILLPALFHFQMNNPVWPDAQPWDSVLLVGVALAVVLLPRNQMLERGAGATRVVPPVDGAGVIES